MAKVKSRYTKDGSYIRNIEPCETVGELKALLEQLPDALPIEANFGRSIKPVWFNVGDEDEHISFEDNDGLWDNDDEEEE